MNHDEMKKLGMPIYYRIDKFIYFKWNWKRKTKASKEMKHILLHYLDYYNYTQPLVLMIDYLRVRFPITDILKIIKIVSAIKSKYLIHEDYGIFGYEEQYIWRY